jgi:hypothetical protein
MLQQIYQSFFESDDIHNKHSLRPRGEWASSVDLHLRVSVWNPALIGLDLPLTTIIGVAGRKMKILTCT